MNPADIFQNNMILQRDKEITIWGTATAGETVYVAIQKKQASALADNDGKWYVQFSGLLTSFDEQMIIWTETEKVLLEHVMIGEVWIAAGQSNMEFILRHEKYYEQEKKNVPNHAIRFYNIPQVSYNGQKEAFDYSRQGIWWEADVHTIGRFSAVGYYFQKELTNHLDVPVGVIGCNWGGTSISSWMSEASVRRTGSIWCEVWENALENQNQDVYWLEQNQNLFNDRSDPCMTPFDLFVLPRTPSADEVTAFFQKHKEDMDIEATRTMLVPQSKPGSLYECMVKPVSTYGVRGVLWYQGENDDTLGQQELYEGMLQAFIEDWRKLWHENDLPFLIAQLPPWERWLALENNAFEKIRACQTNVAAKDERVFICSLSDQGERYDIHPKNKRIVGQRLALLARGHIYGENIICDAPEVTDVERYGQCIRINFANAEGGLYIEGGKISSLHILSESGEVNFSTEIQNNVLVIHLKEDVDDKLTLEYAQEKWYQVNLYNQGNIPATPFKWKVT